MIQNDPHFVPLLVFQGKARGNKCGLWIRWRAQRQLENLGNFIQKHNGKVLFVGILLLSLCCVGLKTVRIETNVEKLWVEGKNTLRLLLIRICFTA